MIIGFIGLGRMGTAMVNRLLANGHEVVAYNRSPEPVREIERRGAVGAYSIEELIRRLEPPRIIWLMISAGRPVDEVIEKLHPYLLKGDVVIDGGNSHYKDSLRRGEILKKKGSYFLDVGTSGGIAGAETGYCFMIGGDREAFEIAEPLFEALAAKDGYLYVGGPGSGHYVKMVHNAIEYGMMQAVAEGFSLLKNGEYKDLSLKDIAKLWNNGSIIRSFLMELVYNVLENEEELSEIVPSVEDSGEARWFTIEAVEKGVPSIINTCALYARFISRDEGSFAFKLIAALRRQFGGHEVKKRK